MKRNKTVVLDLFHQIQCACIFGIHLNAINYHKLANSLNALHIHMCIVCELMNMLSHYCNSNKYEKKTIFN